MCFNPSPERRVPSPNRYMAFAKFCFCKNNKRTIDRHVPHTRQLDGGKTDVLLSANGPSTAALQLRADADVLCQQQCWCKRWMCCANSSVAAKMAQHILIGPEPFLAAHARSPTASGSHSLAGADSAPHCGTEFHFRPVTVMMSSSGLARSCS
jgi:hypothetical protein